LTTQLLNNPQMYEEPCTERNQRPWMQKFQVVEQRPSRLEVKATTIQGVNSLVLKRQIIMRVVTHARS
jgi:hypothetical protein